MISIFADWSAEAGNCSTVDLRAKFPGLLRTDSALPVRSQGFLPFCSAFAAADLLSFRYQKAFSGLHAALVALDGKYTRKSSKYLDMDYVIKKVLQNGVCLESEIPSSEGDGSERYWGNNKRVWGDLVSFTSGLRNTGELDVPLGCDLASSRKMPFPSLSEEELLSIVQESPAEEVVMNALEAMCKSGRFTFPEPQPRIVLRTKPDYQRPKEGWGPSWDKDIQRDLKDQKTFLGAIDKQLDAGNPAATTYDVRMITRKESDSPLFSEEELRHTSPVVGRKLIGGKCHYLFRNSYGKFWKSPISGTVSEDGNVWVSADRVYKHSWRVFYLE